MRIFIKLPFWLICIFSLVCSSVTSARLDSYTALDLQLISPSDLNILDVFATPYTREGSRSLSEFLLNPSADRDLLCQRQQVLRFLISHEKISFVSTLFKRIGSDEKLVRKIFFDAEQKVILHDVLKSFLFSTPFLKRFNTSAVALNVRHVAQGFSPALTAGLEFGVLHFAGKYLTSEPAHSHKSSCHSHHKKSACSGHGGGDCGASHESVAGHKREHEHEHENCGCISHIKTDNLKGFIKGAVFTAKAAHIALHLWAIKDMVESLNSKIALLQHVQNGVNALKSVCVNAQKIVHILRKNSTPDDVVLSELLDQIEQSLAKITTRKRSLKKEKLHLLSPLGSVVAEYQRLSLVQETVAHLLSQLGLLDVYVAVAQTMLSHADQENTYCYASFAEGEKPLLSMEHGWLPALELSSHGAIVSQSFNSEELGSCQYVLSGPNGAGKSTFLRCLGYNVVLAQTFGIAAACTFTLTPYQNISSFMSVEDDVKMGLSSFIAKYRRVEQLQEIADGLEDAKGLGLFLFDDALGQGTNTVIGERFALKTLKKFAENKSILMVAATHFSGVVEHAQDTNSHFKNIHIALKQDDFSNASSSYAVVVGAANLADTTLLVNKGNL